MRKAIMLLTGLLLMGAGFAQTRLVTNQYIRTKVTDKTYTQKTGTTIPNDNLSINTANAKAWLVLEERFLPAQAGRIPWNTEILPMETNISCNSGSNMQVCQFPLNYYGPCGSYIYTAGFASNMQAFTRERFAATSAFWNGDLGTGKVRLHVFSNEILVEDKLINASGVASVVIPGSATRTYRVEIYPKGI